ncbi:low molecular weight protein arginine phosphatase [Vallitalea okinawensis]|uniref:low molecular weight protein arginine phosphatase n=1 Tax=Vallitalea okinawensis TaxID=2078660 RepID=UPI000CFD383B|nr:low molecular weight protein arginine phosphatase [Vallitalea okinawensis]
MWHRIIFVCTGNTCRSPMAERLMMNELGDNIGELKVISRGLSVLYPQGANEKAHEQMKQRGIDLSNHEATLLSDQDMDDATLVLTMTHRHKQVLVSSYPSYENNFFTLKEYVHEEGDVEDPFGSSDEIYEKCAKELQYLVKRLVELIIEI